MPSEELLIQAIPEEKEQNTRNMYLFGEFDIPPFQSEEISKNKIFKNQLELPPPARKQM